MLSSVAILLAAAAVAPWVCRRWSRWTGWIAAVPPGAITIYFATRVSAVASGETPETRVDWVPSLGVELALRLDGLSILFALLISGIGTGIFVYSGGYLRGNPHIGRFVGLLYLFTAAMLGLVLADNLIALLVFWELTTICSFLLIGFRNEDAAARRSARQALLVTVLGGFALIPGLLLLGAAADTYTISEITERGEAIGASPAYTSILSLVLLGCFTKSAQFPFHFWLPNAMVAPTPVSAFLHSATMVQAGVYLLARLEPALGGTTLWSNSLMLAGTGTAILASGFALRQTDLKRMLAYTTIVSLGQLIALLGAGTHHARTAFVLYLMAHAAYKCAMFLGAGAIEHETGTRDITRINGLRHRMPFVAVVVLLASLSYASLPPFLGYLSKEEMYAGLLDASDHGGPAAALFMLINAVLVITAALAFAKPFLGRRIEAPHTPAHVPASFWSPALLFAGGGLALGLMPGPIGTWMVEPALRAISGETASVDLSFWHGVRTPFVLGMLTLALGAAGYASWGKLKRLLDRMAHSMPYRSDNAYEAALRLFQAGGRAVDKIVQHGVLRAYTSALILVGSLAVFGGMLGELPIVDRLLGISAEVPDLGLLLLLLAGSWGVALAPSRLPALLAYSVVGMAAALVYMVFGAPDVAIAQFMVSSILAVIVVLVLLRLPASEPFQHRDGAARVRDLLVSAAFGIAVTLVLLGALSEPFSGRIGEYYVRHSVPEAHAHNVVSAILTDFRALDTLGETLVIAMAGFGVLAIFRMWPGSR